MSTRRYAAILGNLGNTRDRFCSGYKENPDTLTMLKRAAGIPDVSGIELVGTWDIRSDNVREMKRALGDAGLECVSIIPDLFADRTYWKGSYSSNEARVRQQAKDYTQQMCDIAREMKCPTINIWPGQDGYDYLLCSDYDSSRKWLTESLAALATANPDLKFALEYKPKEPRTHSYLARMAAMRIQRGGAAERSIAGERAGLVRGRPSTTAGERPSVLGPGGGGGSSERARPSATHPAPIAKTRTGTADHRSRRCPWGNEGRSSGLVGAATKGQAASGCGDEHQSGAEADQPGT